MKNQSYAKILVIICFALLLLSIILSTFLLQRCDSDDENDDLNNVVTTKRKKNTDDGTSEQEDTSSSDVTSTDQAETTTTTQTTTTGGIIDIITPPPQDMPQPNETDALLFEANGISVYYRGVSDTFLGKEILFFTTNATEITATVRVEVKAINRLAIGASNYADLVPYSAGIIAAPIGTSKLESAGITEISEVTVTISAYDDSYHDLFADQTITFVINQASGTEGELST